MMETPTAVGVVGLTRWYTSMHVRAVQVYQGYTMFKILERVWEQVRFCSERCRGSDIRNQPDKACASEGEF
jgi:hypothetical protein